MNRNAFYVTTTEVYNFLNGIDAPEIEMYVHLSALFANIANRNGGASKFAAHTGVFRLAFRNVVGVERERAMWATYLDKYGKQLCGRCGGIGGASQWPGYTCFDCGGKGWADKQ